jgi:hypothetical protein
MVQWHDTEWSSGGGWQKGQNNKGKHKTGWQPDGQGAAPKGSAFTWCLACGHWVFDDKLVGEQGGVCRCGKQLLKESNRKHGGKWPAVGKGRGGPDSATAGQWAKAGEPPAGGLDPTQLEFLRALDPDKIIEARALFPDLVEPKKEEENTTYEHLSRELKKATDREVHKRKKAEQAIKHRKKAQ